MYLLIDLSEFDEISLSLFDEQNINSVQYSERNRELLASIDKFLLDSKLGVDDIGGIMLVVGSGSFTNTRISAVVANTFAYAKNIPLLAIKKEQVSEVQKLIPILLAQPVGQYVSATYSAPPHIG